MASYTDTILGDISGMTAAQVAQAAKDAGYKTPGQTAKETVSAAKNNGTYAGAASSYIDDSGNKQMGTYNGPTYADALGGGTGSTGSKTVQVGADGKAPTGLGVGDRVVTGGGVYTITGINPDGTYKTGAADTSYGTAQSAQGVDALYRHILGQGSGQSQPGMNYASAMSTQQAAQYGDTGLNNLLAQLEQNYQQQLSLGNQTAAAQTQQAILQLQKQKDALNSQYDDLYRQLYIDRRMAEKNMPQQLSAMGYNGGLTETSLLGLQTGYQDALRGGEISRLQGTSDLDMAMTNAQLTGDIAAAQAAAEAANNYYNSYANVTGKLQDQSNWNRQFTYQQAMDERQYQTQQEQMTYSQAMAQNEYLREEGLRNIMLGLMPSAEQLAALGYDSTQAAAQIAAYKAQAKKTTTGTGTKAAAKPNLTYNQTMQAIEAGDLTPNVMAAYEYYHGTAYEAKDNFTPTSAGYGLVEQATSNLLNNQNYTADDARKYLIGRFNAGAITEAEGDYLLSKYFG